MKVAKILSGIISAFVVFSLLIGCGAKEEVTVSTISASLEEMCLSNENVYEISKSDIENQFNFDCNLLGDSFIKMSNDEEKYMLVAVMQIKEKESRQTVIDGINATVKTAATSFSVLGTNQFSQIQQRLMYEYQDIIIVVIAENYEAPTKYLEKIGAKKIV